MCRYQAAHLSAKQAWEAKYPAGTAPAPKATKKRTKKSKAGQEATTKAAKTPPTAYSLYVKQNFASYTKPGASAPETMKVMAAAWKQLPEGEKAKYKVTA